MKTFVAKCSELSRKITISKKGGERQLKQSRNSLHPKTEQKTIWLLFSTQHLTLFHTI